MNRKILYLFSLWSSLIVAQTTTKPIELQKIVLEHAEEPNHFFSKQPLSANVFVLEDLDEHGIRSVQDVTSEIPNFNYMEFGTRSFHSVVGVRGLTNTAFFSDPSVVFYVDDIPYGNAFSYNNLTFAVDKIEAYRGSQGDLFGKNSYGGVFNVTSIKPKNDIESHLSTEIGRYNRWITNGLISGGMIQDQLFFSLGASYGQGDGYLKNTYLNNTPDDEQFWSGRASLIWKPNKFWDISMIFSGDTFDDDTPRYVALDSDRLEIQSNQNGKIKQTSNTEALRIQYRHNNVELLSVTSRRDWEADPVFVDGDFSPVPFVTVNMFQRQTQISQEFRLRSSNDDMDWLIGFYFNNNKFELRNLTTAATDTLLRGGSIKNDSYALFANASYYLSNKIHLHIGGRFDYVSKHLDQRHNLFEGQLLNLKSDREDFFISPKISLDYQFNDHMLSYVTAGLAYKPGGYSTGATQPGLEEYDSERLQSIETGIKSHWLNNRIHLNLAFFYYRIKNYQIEKFLSFLDYSIVNAPRVNSYGIETEATFEVVQNFNLETTFGYNRVKFDRYIDPVTGSDLSGNTPPHNPEINFMFAAHYQHPNGYFARAEWNWTGKTYFDDANSPAFERDDYSSINTRIGYKGKNFDVIFYGENLSDERYVTFILPSFNAKAPVRPRSLGIKVALHY